MRRKARANRFVYRDTRTGRFASRATWKRSKAHKGTRYVRQRIRKPVGGIILPPKPPKPSKLYEWIITLLPSKNSERQIDFIVTAATEAEALPFLTDFLIHDKRGRHMAKFYVVENIACGNLSKHKAGYVEYRGEIPDEE